ncbi:hypothetical protein Tco_1033480 [Tanacetum coccineum]
MEVVGDFSKKFYNSLGSVLVGVVQKLKSLKKPFRKLLRDQGNLHERVNRPRHELDEVQKALYINTLSLELREEEAAYVQAFNGASLDVELFLK